MKNPRSPCSRLLKYHFFLGGHDAEMMEIRNILNEYNLIYIDKSLQWGAKLSEYETELSHIAQNAIPVLIELELDINPPANAIIIDHHNERAGHSTPSSIEQVCTLIEHNPTRHQQLISANDKAYIDGMLAINATPSEIDEIRKIDRRCQGVTAEDERLAELSILEHQTSFGTDAILVKSLTERTSPILDLLYNKYKHLFIITPDNHTHYSGTGEIVQKLVKVFQLKQLQDSELKIWWGGNLPDKGFFGTNSPLTETEIGQLLK